ncbi:MAG: DUF503 domain-containing protein [Acidobacteriota bacterium]
MSAPLFIGLAELELHLPAARSLKDKRQEIRSLIDRLRHRLSLLVVERDHQDLHQRSALAMAAFATEAEAARMTVERGLDLVHQNFDGMVLDEHVEVVQVR